MQKTQINNAGWEALNGVILKLGVQKILSHGTKTKGFTPFSQRGQETIQFLRPYYSLMNVENEGILQKQSIRHEDAHCGLGYRGPGPYPRQHSVQDGGTAWMGSWSIRGYICSNTYCVGILGNFTVQKYAHLNHLNCATLLLHLKFGVTCFIYACCSWVNSWPEVNHRSQASD